MRQLAALIRKDALLLLRDRWGLAHLFVMPWALVMLMTYLQDSTFRVVHENRIPVYLLDADADSLGTLIGRQLAASPIFDVATTGPDGRPLTERETEEAVARGDYMMGVVIPANATQRLRQQIGRQIGRIFDGDDPATGNPDTLTVRILIDPATKSSFRATLAGSMRENALSIQNQLILTEIARQINRRIPMPVDLDFDTAPLIAIREAYAQSAHTRIIPNSVQHNVPAWSMFAIFFIVVSLAGNMIREREIGCYRRLMTMPCPYPLYLLGKIAVYLPVCLLQLSLIVATGIYIIPRLGLPALTLGHSFVALVGMALAASLAAIGYGLAIGSVARTNQQASVFGAVSVVILAAVGGVWIPTFVMPDAMRAVSRISPLNWGLNGFNELFVRDTGATGVAPWVAALLLFFGAMLLLAIWGNRRHSREND